MTDIHAVAVVLVFKSLQIEGVLVGAANSKHGPYHPTCGELEFGGNAYKALSVAVLPSYHQRLQLQYTSQAHQYSFSAQ